MNKRICKEQIISDPAETTSHAIYSTRTSILHEHEGTHLCLLPKLKRLTLLGGLTIVVGLWPPPEMPRKEDLREKEFLSTQREELSAVFSRPA